MPSALAALHSAVANETLTKAVSITRTEAAKNAYQIYRDALQAAGRRSSMSSTGNPYHNAQAESSMKTLKVEDVCGAGYESLADVSARLPICIEQVHNAKRLHLALGYRPPAEFESPFAQQAA